MRSPYLTALLNPLNLLMLGLSAVAGLVAAWWLFPLGLLLWAVMVVAVARDPSLRMSRTMQQRAPLAARFQTHFDRIERSQVGIFNALNAAPPPVRRALNPVQSEVDGLTNQVYRLCQRMTALENYRVVSQSGNDLQADLARMDQLIEKTSDPVIRREHQESRQAMASRLAKLQAIQTQLERVEAQLLSLVNEMDALLTEIIRIQGLGSDHAARYVPALVDKIRRQSAGLEAFEREASGP